MNVFAAAVAAAAAMASPVAGQPPALSITVSDQRQEAAGDDRAAFEITLTNDGDQEVALSLRALLPTGLADASSPEAAIEPNKATWTVSVPPRGKASRTLTARFAEVEEPTKVALTVCAHQGGQAHPLVCATDVNTINRKQASLLWWLGLGVAAVGAAGGGVWYLRRKCRAS